MNPTGAAFRARLFFTNSTRACAPGDGLYRSLPDSPLGLRNAHRGNTRGPARRGEIRQGALIGASSMFAWQFTKALYLADLHGWTRFVSMQNHYNLLYREEEREMLPLCRAENIGVIPWSPLARGRLARPWQMEKTKRFETDGFGKSLYSKTEILDHAVVDRLTEMAGERGVSNATLALAWMLSKAGITSPIVGATKPHHLTEAVAALSLRLTPQEIAALEEPYVPHLVAGFN